MTRLPPLPYDAIDPEQREIWDRIVATRGGIGSMTDATGSLIGPFHALVRRPSVGKHLLEVGQNLRFGNAAPDSLLEIAICTVGAHWKSEFEFWAHSRFALAAGVSQAALDALAAGTAPDFDRPEEQLVHAWAHALVTTGHTDESQYTDLVDAIGLDAVIDLTLTCGYYCQISFVLNAFAVALPDGVDPVWH